MEQCTGTDSSVWSSVLGPIVERGAVCCDRELSMELCVGTESSVWSGVFGPIVQYGAVYWN